MRLFIAICFPESVKDALHALSEKMRAKSLQGNFIRRENLHLTLAFLGETGRVDKIRTAMDRTVGSPFFLETRKLGRVRREGGDIWWLGLNESPRLIVLQKRLSDVLTQEGFAQEERDYRPHLTLGRKVVFPAGYELSGPEWDIPPLKLPVEGITLMNSERIGPKLVYTPIYHKALRIR